MINDPDEEWCLSELRVIAKYADKIIVVEHRTVWGSGKAHRIACAAAVRKPGCSPKGQGAVVVMPFVSPVSCQCGVDAANPHLNPRSPASSRQRTIRFQRGLLGGCFR
jgi:hypothetical protein